MRIRISIGLAVVVSLAHAPFTSAQIITTMTPVQRQQPQGGAATTAQGRPVTFHVMAGYTDWKFGFLKDYRATLPNSFGTPSAAGAEKGYIGAADVAAAVGENLSVGAGGWVNHIDDLVTAVPQYITLTQTFGAYSLYGNVFYKHIGVQAGIVPFRSHNTSVGANGFTVAWNSNQMDVDLFAVSRFSSSRPEERRWSAMAGAGLYRYGSRPAVGEFVGVPASPSGGALSAFANASVGIHKGLFLDASVWYTAADPHYRVETSGGLVNARGLLSFVSGNASQARFIVGMGYGR